MRQKIETNFEAMLMDDIQRLEQINKQIGKLQAEKDILVENIVNELGHAKDGSTTYEVNEYKVTVKTPLIYSLDKKAYEGGDVYLPDGFDPIKVSKSYTVDKKLCNKFMESAPISVRETLNKLITTKPGKANVTILERT